MEVDKSNGQTVTCYLRVAETKKGTHLFAATTAMPRTPLQGTSWPRESLPTRVIRINLALPPGLFGPDAEVTLAVPDNVPEIVAEVEVSDA